MIELFTTARNQGRTKRCVEVAAEKFAYIICRDKRAAYRCVKMAEDMGLDIPFPITFSEFLKGEFISRGIKGFIIDDLDEMVRRLAQGVPVELVTWEQNDDKV